MLALRSGSSSRLCASSAGHACRVPSSNLSLKAFSTSIRCARQHPLEPRGGRAAPAASSSKPEQEQKWSSQTLVGLATFVGAATYLLAKATSNASDNNSIASSSSGSEINIPKPSKSDFDAAMAEIKKLLPADAITSDHTAVESCVAPWSYQNPAALPGAVLYPSSTEEVQAICRTANKYGIPLIPFSGLTSLEGHCHAPNLTSESAESSHLIEPAQLPMGHAWCLSFSENMNSIIQLNKDDLDVVVQPGIPYEVLNNELKESGLFFPTDPGPGAQIGGMVGTGASGTNAVRYGTMRENVIYLTVVMADGSVVKTRQRAKKSSAGPNLGQLFIGSEGTLGIVTEICLKLQPTLPYTVAVASFPGIADAATCVRNIVQSGIQVQCVELMDDLMVKCTNEYAKSQPDMRQWPDKPALFFKFSGNEKQLANDVERAASVVQGSGGSKLVFATSEKEKEDLWYSRKVALWSALDYRPGSKSIVTDVCVPISKLPQMVARLKEHLDAENLMAPIVGHAGDGNLHALILFETEDERKRAKVAVHKMIDIAQELDGTCTGEHGVGLGKKSSLEAELGPGTVTLLRQIKSNLDPKGILNPLKLYPELK